MERLDKKIFGTLFFSIFAAVTGVGVVVPLLPIYAHDLGASGLYIGLIFGAFSEVYLNPYPLSFIKIFYSFSNLLR